MKQILLLLFFMVSVGLSAQISFQEEELQVNFAAEGVYDLKNELEVTNAGAEDAEFIWKVDVVEAPAEWNFFVCDFNKCYGPGDASIDADAANTSVAGETKNMQFHLTPASTSGMGTYMVTLMDPDNPQDVLTTITLVFDGTLVNTKEENISQLAVFPNPVQDYFQLNNPENVASEVVLYDLLGKQIVSFDAQSSKEFYIGDLSEGRYFARIFDEDGQSLKVIKLVKRHHRP